MNAAGNSAQAHLAQALRAFQAGSQGEAQQLCRRVLELSPRDAEALHLLGLAACQSGDRALGVALLQLAIDEQPAAPQYWYNLGVTFQELGRLNDACDAYEQCLLFEPSHLDACNNYAEVVRRTEKFGRALAFYDSVQRRGVPLKALHLHRAVALACLERDEEAETAFRRSLAEEPGWVTAPFEFSQVLLRRHNFKEGWQHYERRFDAPHLMLMDCARLPVPRWTGEPLAGKRILVHREQGLGDQIMFASMLQDLARLGAQVWLDCAGPLRELFRESFTWARQVSVVPEEGLGLPPGGPDFEVPIGSLCQVLRQDASTFERRPYLKPAAGACEVWRGRLEQAGLSTLGTKRIGVVWSSNPAHGLWGPARRAQRKSIELRQLAGLCHGAARLVSLHNEPPPADLPFEVADFSGLLTDLHQTAALASCMDLVVTVDTAVAHLCAAMGKRTWILLPRHADWRWGVDDKTSYWYPQTRLFRQTSAGQWDDVLGEVAGALPAALGERA